MSADSRPKNQSLKCKASVFRDLTTQYPSGIMFQNADYVFDMIAKGQLSMAEAIETWYDLISSRPK